MVSLLVEQGDWDSLRRLMSGMSNKDFRNLQVCVRTQILPRLPHTMFWQAYDFFVSYRRQAFLPGIVAIRSLVNNGSLDLGCEEAKTAARHLREQDDAACIKLVRMALPYLDTQERMTQLFLLFGIDQPAEQVKALLPVKTPEAYYLMLQTLVKAHDGTDMAMRCCQYLVKQGDDFSFNMSAILKAQFNLNSLQSIHSLTVLPYEISLIEQSFSHFKKVLEGKKPIVGHFY